MYSTVWDGGRVGLLKSHDVILFCQLCPAAQLPGASRVGVVLHDDVHIVAGGFTGGLHAGFYHLQLFWSQQAGGIQEVEGLAFFITIKEIDLDRVKAFVQCQLDVVCVIRGVTAHRCSETPTWPQPNCSWLA